MYVGVYVPKSDDIAVTYPGAKHWLFDRLVDLLPDGTQEIVSPFFGGGSLEINLALRGIRVHGYDKFPPLPNFWQYWLDSPSKIIASANGLLNIYSKSELQRLKKQRYPEICSNGEYAAALFYALNRLSFNGAPCSHVRPYALRYDGHYIKDWHDRHNGRRVFTKTEFWESCRRLPISVECSEFTQSLAAHPNLFAFCDPPYPNVVSRLYGDSRAYHEDFDHIALYNILKDRKLWGATYNDIPFIRDLYSDFQMIPMKRPGDSWGKNKKELLIVSDDIAERMHRLPSQLMLDFMTGENLWQRELNS